MIQLCIGTRNKGKQQEFKELLADWPTRIVFPQDIGLDLDVVESEQTFAKIAVQKARAFSQASQMLAMADDSGLEVDALNGAPGIYTARYAGPQASDRDRYEKLLAALTTVPFSQRTARFQCAIALSWPNGDVLVTEGTCEGFIALAPTGTLGFGYDPVFYVPEYDCTMAELDNTIKNQISHRARAIQAARLRLEQRLAPPSGTVEA